MLEFFRLCSTIFDEPADSMRNLFGEHRKGPPAPPTNDPIWTLSR